MQLQLQSFQRVTPKEPQSQHELITEEVAYNGDKQGNPCPTTVNPKGRSKGTPVPTCVGWPGSGIQLATEKASIHVQQQSLQRVAAKELQSQQELVGLKMAYNGNKQGYGAPTTVTPKGHSKGTAVST